MTNLYPEEKLILLSGKVFPTSADLILATQLVNEVKSWEKLTVQAVNRAMAPMLYKLFLHQELKHKVPDFAFKKLEAAYFTTLYRSMLLLNAWTEIASALSGSGIRAVALKGIYLSEHLYSDVGLRQLSDIDLLVSPVDGEKALEVLAALGYKSSQNPFSAKLGFDEHFVHYPPLLRDGLSVEVHIRLHRPHTSYRLDTDAFFERSVPVKINGAYAYTLSFYDQLLFLCVHSEKHFTGSKIQFTCFTDIANILIRFADSIDWDKVIAHCHENHCEAVVFKHLILTSRFFGIPIPEIYTKKFRNTVTTADEEVFIRFLRGYLYAGNHFSNFSANVASIKGTSEKMRFIASNLFPPKSYMMHRYHIRNEKFFWVYYIYRFYIAFSGLFGKMKTKAKWVKEK